jgi:hypothetical protein
MAAVRLEDSVPSEEEQMDSITRRSFLERAGVAAASLGGVAEGKEPKGTPGGKKAAQGPAAVAGAHYAVARCVTEWAYSTGKAYADPFNEVELDVVFTDPEGRGQRVPAFWAGEQTWRVRYAPSAPGRYPYRTISSDAANPDLHGQSGALEVSPYTGDNPLRKHGPVRVASDRLHFEHEDGTPFFWLGDTWWMGLCRRLRWPEDVQTLAADRVKKGFTVIQIVAGLYPDMPAFDPRGANEAGFPWEPEYARINPRYFDAADLRIQYLVDQGLVPCVVGCWGYYLPWMGVPKLKQHWRYIIARWGYSRALFRWFVIDEINGTAKAPNRWFHGSWGQNAYEHTKQKRFSRYRDRFCAGVLQFNVNVHRLAEEEPMLRWDDGNLQVCS